MKKIILTFLIILSILSFYLVSASAQETEQKTLIGNDNTYDSTKYSNYYIGGEVQGQNGWYLYGGSVDDGYKSFSAVGLSYNMGAKGNLWKNDDSGVTWNGIWYKNEFHSFGKCGVVAVWKAPSTGSVSFSGKISDVTIGGGYTVNIYNKKDNKVDLINGIDFVSNKEIYFNNNKLNVEKNEQYIFEMNPKSNDEMKCGFYIYPDFESDGVDIPDSIDKYDDTVAGVLSTQYDNEFYKYSMEYQKLDDVEFTKYYSNTQGENGLYYLQGNINEKYSYMKNEGDKWRGSQYQYIFNNFEMTTGTDGNDSIILYRAGNTGKLTGIIREKNTSYSNPNEEGYDGVEFKIVIKRYNSNKKAFDIPEVLFTRNVECDYYFVKTSVLSLKVNCGDLIAFVVNAKETNWADHYYVMPKMSLKITDSTISAPDDIDREPSYEDQFSTNQGDNGWYYMTGFMNEYYKMISDADSYVGIDAYNSISAFYMTPGNIMAAIRMYACRETGTIKISGFLQKVNHKAEEYGDGITFKYMLLNKETYIDKHIEGNDYSVIDISKTIDVEKGDIVVFYVDSGKYYYNAYDTVTLKVFIEYISSLNDAEDKFELGDKGIINSYPRHPMYLSQEELGESYNKVQGENGWYYAYGSFLNGYYLMRYNVYQDRWENPTLNTYTRLLSSGLHPGYDNEESILIKRINQKGKINILGFANKHQNAGDGVLVSIYKNGDLLKQLEIMTTKRECFIINTEVNVGDIIALSVGNKIGNSNSCDFTDTNFVVDYLEKDGEAVEFTDNDIGQITKTYKKPDTVLFEESDEIKGNGCKNNISANSILIFIAVIVSCVILVKEKKI